MCSEQDPLSLFKGLPMSILVFHRKKLEPRVLSQQQHRRGPSVCFAIYISGVKFEEHFSNIFGTETKEKKIFQKGKRRSFSL